VLDYKKAKQLVAVVIKEEQAKAELRSAIASKDPAMLRDALARAAELGMTEGAEVKQAEALVALKAAIESRDREALEEAIGEAEAAGLDLKSETLAVIADDAERLLASKQKLALKLKKKVKGGRQPQKYQDAMAEIKHFQADADSARCDADKADEEEYAKAVRLLAVVIKEEQAKAELRSAVASKDPAMLRDALARAAELGMTEGGEVKQAEALVALKAAIESRDREALEEAIGEAEAAGLNDEENMNRAQAVRKEEQTRAELRSAIASKDPAMLRDALVRAAELGMTEGKEVKQAEALVALKAAIESRDREALEEAIGAAEAAGMTDGEEVNQAKALIALKVAIVALEALQLEVAIEEAIATGLQDCGDYEKAVKTLKEVQKEEEEEEAAISDRFLALTIGVEDAKRAQAVRKEEQAKAELRSAIASKDPAMLRDALVRAAELGMTEGGEVKQAEALVALKAAIESRDREALEEAIDVYREVVGVNKDAEYVAAVAILAKVGEEQQVGVEQQVGEEQGFDEGYNSDHLVERDKEGKTSEEDEEGQAAQRQEEQEEQEGGDVFEDVGSIYRYSAAAAKSWLVDVVMDLAHDHEEDMTIAVVLVDLEWHDGEIVEWSDGTCETDEPEHQLGYALIEFDGEMEQWVQLNWLRFVEHKTEKMMRGYPPGHEVGRWWTDEPALKEHKPADMPDSPWAVARHEDEAKAMRSGAGIKGAGRAPLAPAVV
jgi:hypothetical protein